MRCWPPIRNTVGRPRCRCLPASCATPTSPRHRAPTSAESHRRARSEEHTSELQSPCNLVCRLLLEKENHTTALQSPCHPLCGLLLAPHIRHASPALCRTRVAHPVPRPAPRSLTPTPGPAPRAHAPP